jgi:hypothetical protein
MAAWTATAQVCDFDVDDSNSIWHTSTTDHP